MENKFLCAKQVIFDISHKIKQDDSTTAELELAIKQQEEHQPRVLINSNSNVNLADPKLGRTPSVVLNPALHSAAGNVSAIYSPNTGSGANSDRENQLLKQYPAVVTTTSGSENERCSSQNSTTAAAVRHQQSKKRNMLKDQVNSITRTKYQTRPVLKNIAIFR